MWEVYGLFFNAGRFFFSFISFIEGWVGSLDVLEPIRKTRLNLECKYIPQGFFSYLLSYLMFFKDFIKQFFKENLQQF